MNKMTFKDYVIMTSFVVAISFLVLWWCKITSDSVQEQLIEARLEGIKIGRNLMGA